MLWRDCELRSGIYTFLGRAQAGVRLGRATANRAEDALRNCPWFRLTLMHSHKASIPGKHLSANQ